MRKELGFDEEQILKLEGASEPPGGPLGVSGSVALKWVEPEDVRAVKFPGGSKNTSAALAGWLSWSEPRPICLGCGFDPSRSTYKKQPMRAYGSGATDRCVFSMLQSAQSWDSYPPIPASHWLKAAPGW